MRESRPPHLAPQGSRRSAALSLFRELRQQIEEDRVTGLAAEVAFFAVLSIFPALLMIAAALGQLEVLVGSDLAERSQQQILDFLDLILTKQAAGALNEVEALFAEERPGVVTAATLVAVWALGRGMAAVIRALNLAYSISERRSWLKQRLLALGLSAGAVVISTMTIAVIVVGPLLGRGEEVADTVGVGEGWILASHWIRWPIAFILMVAGASVLMHIAPDRPTCSWKEDVPGALLASTLWLIVSTGFSIYLRLAPGANAILGALGGGLILLVWLYLLSISLLLGGEVNALLARTSNASP
ncbi:MAG TPA: YihY/virulence factor BrkB family protein [Thermomicrobiales bacterium]|nr:YihY/virulence factor BrkB family protein [Thermomicrobiales bacterium]